MKSNCAVIYINNALDEETKIQRNISSDSQAASNKVFSIARVLGGTSSHCLILSLGRGLQNKSFKWHRSKCNRNCSAVSIKYCSFWHAPFFTHIVTIVSLAVETFQILRSKQKVKVLIYNRSFHYLGALLILRLFRAEVFLDLEDGYLDAGNNYPMYLKNLFTKKLFDFLCPSGVMICNSGLIDQVQKKNLFLCYGVTPQFALRRNSNRASRIKILFGGSLVEGTGTQLLISAIECMVRRDRNLVEKFEFTITGKGPYSHSVRELACKNSTLVQFFESLSYEDYLGCLMSNHIGVSLRVSGHQMSHTTFPSKIIEYAFAGLAIVSTRSIDIEKAFGANLFYLENETPECLAALLFSLQENSSLLQHKAHASKEAVEKSCGTETVRSGLIQFLRLDDVICVQE